ncbi:hypothetical protein K0U91_15685 [Chryseobacterium chendengshani]|uniref:DUF6438 domain-containing protein n=1 Tax=Chryseobacterium sp. LJ668 TaxID=2864040 RepID=UPI001C68F155|nr:hypothetical protein [Chryseobacterium sp. LJ668]MBW8522950.1 hypothetical protein [Chryseobacterium sp. LJ668]QYK16479.1 hypothetical protein K0U91_15685 [Chryseobacterium sp. LJ668]
MKFIILLIGTILLQSCEKKKLNEKEILEIIHSHEEYKDLELKTAFSYGYDYIDSIKSLREIINKESFNSIYEADFNHDSKKDYLVNLSYPKSKNENDIVQIFIEDDHKNTLVILSSKRGYQILNPGKQKIYDIISAKIIRHKNRDLIKLLSFKKHIDNKNDILKYDTLMIKNNQLTEFTSTNYHHIEKIVFNQNGGYAPGRIYSLTLKKDSTILHSYYYKNLKGNYFGRDNLSFKNLSKYLNDINFSNLKNRYSIDCKDCSSIEIEIIFDNGKTTNIYDYGEKGTLGLTKFYGKIDTIMDKQKWKKVN